MNIVDFEKLKPGREDPQTGFYIVAQCPECQAPIFWHGPGEINGEQAGEIPLPTCLCMSEEPFEMALPLKYEYEIERNSIMFLFREYYSLLRDYGVIMEELENAGHTVVGTADGSGSTSGSESQAQEEGQSDQ